MNTSKPEAAGSEDVRARVVLDTIPFPVLVVDPDVRVMDLNAAAVQLLGPDVQSVLRQRAGSLFNCLHALTHPEGCGRSEACKDCAVRGSVGRSFNGEKVLRRKAEMRLVARVGEPAVEVHLLVTTTPMEWQGQRLTLVLLEDITELTRLRALLPICAWCKRVRDDREYWQSVEGYFEDHMEVQFTHGICPDCLAHAQHTVDALAGAEGRR